MTFDLSDYVDVAERIRRAREKFPELRLQSEWEMREVDGQLFIIVKAFAYRSETDQIPCIGHAWEIYPGRTPYTKGSELMNAETSAFGRCLLALIDLEAGKVASREEVQQAQARQEAVPPSQREVKAPSEWSGESNRGTDRIIKEPGALPSEKQLMALVNKTTKLGINSDFHQAFWRFCLDGGKHGSEQPINKGEASKLIGMDKTDFEGYGASFFATLLEKDPLEEAPPF